MNNFNFKNLTPFKWFVLENFPFIEADFDSLTEWQLFCKLGKEINKIIDSQNIVGKQSEQLTKAFIELQNYVNNYFKNLDVQDEINNKLNEMAESGQLTDLIAQYLQLAGLLCYNTKNDMKRAENLINGSFAKTMGDINYNDGKGQFYKIRNILNTDIVDNINIIALQNSNLIAELLPNYYIEEIKNNVEEGITIMMGDSYGLGQSNPSNVTGWCDLLKNLLNINDNNYYKFVKGGCGFIGYGDSGNTFINLLQNNISQITDKTKVKNFIISAGSNDIDFVTTETNRTRLKNSVQAFFNYVKQQFPNAKITLFHQGYTTADTIEGANARDNINMVYLVYRTALISYDIKLYHGSCYCLRDKSLMSSDTVHPTQEGYNRLAQSMYNLYTTGQNNNFENSLFNTNRFNKVNLREGLVYGLEEDNHITLFSHQNNNNMEFGLAFERTLFFKTNPIIINNTSQDYIIKGNKIGDIEASYFSTCKSPINIPITGFVVSSTEITPEPYSGYLQIQPNGEVYLVFKTYLTVPSITAMTMVCNPSFYTLPLDYV